MAKKSAKPEVKTNASKNAALVTFDSWAELRRTQLEGMITSKRKALIERLNK